jgi:hypothetical protein
MRFLTIRSSLVVMMTLCIALQTGCKPAGSSEQTSPPNTVLEPAGDSSSVMSDSVNYMHDRSTKYTLYDLSKTPPIAVGGAIVDRLATGGEKGCCLSLPKVWRAGMKVRLDWHESDRDQIYEEHTRELEIPRYDEPADLYVVFYPQHEVEVVVSKGEPGHPTWRGRLKQTPWENCLANNERKVCKRATARTFDTHSVGFCTYTKSADFPKENYDGELLCAAAMHQCMQDYEDPPFCKGILWGERKK